MKLGMTAPEFWLAEDQWQLDIMTLHHFGLSALECSPHDHLIDTRKWTTICRILRDLNMDLTAHAPDFYDPDGFGLTGFRSKGDIRKNYLGYFDRLVQFQGKAPIPLTIHGPSHRGQEALDDIKAFCDFALERIDREGWPLAIALETLATPNLGSKIEDLMHVIETFQDNRLGVCWDITHTRSWSEEQYGQEKFLNAVQTAHIHGFDGKEDHRPLKDFPVSMDRPLDLLGQKGYQGVLTIELLKVKKEDFSYLMQNDLELLLPFIQK